MTTNRLAVRSDDTSPDREPLTALEWAGEALERGAHRQFKLWMAEARRRGEQGCPRYVHWDDSGRKITIKAFPTATQGAG